MTNILLEMAKSVFASPEARQLAGRVISSTALDCTGPGCKGKSPPGFICTLCSKPVCMLHAFGRMKPPGLVCGLCAWDIWSTEPPPPRVAKAPKPRRRK